MRGYYNWHNDNAKGVIFKGIDLKDEKRSIEFFLNKNILQAGTFQELLMKITAIHWNRA